MGPIPCCSAVYGLSARPLIVSIFEATEEEPRQRSERSLVRPPVGGPQRQCYSDDLTPGIRKLAPAAAMATHPVTKTIEPALTVFSGAEIRVVSRSNDVNSTDRAWAHHGSTVTTCRHCRRHCCSQTPSRGSSSSGAFCCLQVLLPVGEAPEAAFERYASLIVQHRQVRLGPAEPRACRPNPWAASGAAPHFLL